MKTDEAFFTVKVKPGRIKIVYSKKGVKKISFPEKKPVLSGLAEAPVFVKKAGKQLQAYYDGKKVKFSCLLDLERFEKFTLAVWEAARAIPYGKTRSYEWVAERIGRPRSARAAGNALGRNPVPIIIPCHRVIRKNGSLGGFGGGIAWKRRLLKLEAQKE